MAENTNMAEKGEQEITCVIHQEHDTDPEVLSCCRCYCRPSVQHITVKTSIDKPFPCPECCRHATLPATMTSVNNTPTAFFENHKKELYSKLELMTHGNVEIKCEMCLEDKAEGFCRQCTKFICVECNRSHQRMRNVFLGHKVSTLEELTDIELLINNPSHEACKQPASVYCYDCNTLICHDCATNNLHGHNCELVLIAAPKAKKELHKQLGPLRESRENILHAIREIQTTIAEVEDQGGFVANNIKISCRELHMIIEDHQEALLAEMSIRVQQKINCLSAQEKNLSAAYAVVQSVIEYTEQCLEHSADGDIMRMRVEMESQIDREIQEQLKEADHLAPAVEADIGVELSCAEDLKQICYTKAKLTQLATEYTITGEGFKSAEVNKTSEFQVVARLSNGKPIKQALVVGCHLKSLHDSTTTCSTVNLRGNTGHIQYTPTVQGRHELIVTVNGQEVAGSPFPVFVSIHPTQLGRPIHAIAGMNHSFCVDVTSAGNIIVRDFPNIKLLIRQERSC